MRRRPPGGARRHSVGKEFEFRLERLEEGGFMVEDEAAQPDSILEEIVWWKEEELASMKEHQPLDLVKQSLRGAPPVRDFKKALRTAELQPGLIAEAKKASPSKGVINPQFDPVETAMSYEDGGAACISVLTDEHYFQGSFENLRLIRKAGIQCPLLCKEFILEAYQLAYARAKGADAVLLITAVLKSADLSYLAKAARSLGLQTLIEVHSHEELDRVLSSGAPIDMLGINNRDLNDFSVSLRTTPQLLGNGRLEELRSRDALVVAESGIGDTADVNFLRDAGADALLVGEQLTQHGDTAHEAIANLYGVH